MALRTDNYGKWLILIVCVITVAIASACSGGEVRGRSVSSLDGKTYLVVDDDNGCEYGGLRVDGSVWNYKLHTKGPITPGPHKMECSLSGTFAFEVRQGTTFHFNYWGP